MLELINSAEKTLIDDNLRAKYDEELAYYLSNDEANYEMDNSVSDADTLIEEARELIRNGRVADAIMVAKKATEIEGQNAEAWATLGYAHSLWKDYDSAIYEYKKATDLQPNEAMYYYDLSFLYLEHLTMPETEKFRLAQLANERARKIDDKESSYLSQAACIARLSHQFDKAISLLEKGLSNYPDDKSFKAELCATYYDKALVNHTFFNEQEGLRYFVTKTDAEKGLAYLEKALHYAIDEAYHTEINEWILISKNALKNKFISPGFKGIGIIAVVVLLGLASGSFWGIVFSAAVAFSFYKWHSSPGWKLNRIILGLN